MADRIEEMRRRREAERSRREAAAVAGFPADFVGPVAPEEATTPEAIAKQALMRARFLAQELGQFRPPAPEESGVGKFGRSGFGQYLAATKAPRIYARNVEALTGEGEKEDIKQRLQAAVNEYRISSEQAADEGKAGADAAKQRAALEELGPLLGAKDEQELLTKAGPAMIRYGVRTGDSETITRGLTQHREVQNFLQKQMETARSEKVRQDLLDTRSAAEAKYGPDAVNSPMALLSMAIAGQYAEGDVSGLAESATRMSNIIGNEAEERERLLRMEKIRAELMKAGTDDRFDVVDKAVKIVTDYGPVGLGLDAAMELVLKAKGSPALADDPRMSEIVKNLTPYVAKIASMKAQLDAAKTTDQKFKALQTIKATLHDKDGNIKLGPGLASSVAMTLSDGTKITYAEAVKRWIEEQEYKLIGEIGAVGQPIEGSREDAAKAAAEQLRQNQQLRPPPM